MATIKQFEDALTAKGIVIHRLSLSQDGVKMASGAKDGKTYTWMADGSCYYSRKRVTEMDINDRLI